MKRLCAFFLAAFFIVSGAAAQAETLTVWTVSQIYAQAYEALAESWNREKPGQFLKVETHVYTPEQIASKLTYAFANGIRFSGDVLPDLADISFQAFPDEGLDSASHFYPLDNLIQESGDAEAEAEAGLYRQGSFCFALPYAYSRLVLCCKTSVSQRFPDFERQAQSFEGLSALALTYQQEMGKALIQADYLGGEMFLALMSLAGDEDAAVSWMCALHQAGALSAIPCGSAQARAFPRWMREDEAVCFVASAGTLLQIAQEDPASAALYTVYPLPSFQGNKGQVRLPETGTAVLLQSGHAALARRFLAYARLTEQAAERNALYWSKENRETEALLSAYALPGGVSVFPELPVCSLPPDGQAAALAAEHPFRVMEP